MFLRDHILHHAIFYKKTNMLNLLLHSIPSRAPSMAAVVSILERSTVSPPKSSVPDTSIPLVFMDVYFLVGGAVERLFFFKYPHSTSHFIDHHLPTFKSSLSLTLQHFFPFAGHVRPSPSSPEDYEIHYADGDSVSLTISESDGDFDELAGDKPKDYSKLKPLIPSLADESEPLAALQLTLFPNNGLCFGISTKKIAADGTTSTNFIHSWAATCLAGASDVSFSSPPSFDRTILVDTGNIYPRHLEAALKAREMYKQYYTTAAAAADAPPDDEAFATFTLKKEHLDKLKAIVMAGHDGKAPFHCSTFVVGCAFMWMCLVRSRGSPADAPAHLGFPIDARPRLAPPLPPGYFGSCIAFRVAEVKVADLVDNDGVRAAAAAIGKVIDELKDGILKGFEDWPTSLSGLFPHRPLWIAGSPKFKVYDVDFGWGKPVKVELTTIKGTGTMSIAESLREGGGLEFGFCFPKPEVEAFEASFTAALEFLVA